MLNFLSAKYQKEIALVFIFTFFIAGLESVKASTVYYNSVNNEALFGTYYQTVNKINTHYHQSVAKNAAEENTSIKTITDTATVRLLSEGMKHIAIAENKLSGPTIGGPGQPEMSGFKSVGLDNMVSPFTGDFSYNIPLLDVGGYPVNMFYSSGITMDQDASWLGLGWNINPGNVMRNMRGLPDDFDGTDIITKQQSIRKDITWGASGTVGLKLVNFPLLGIGVTTGVS
ncbi:MAG: hypothetical protein HY305_07395, partial [Sphingobacteriales bacterium]|nr:hypothetical protein [Sphingobacteriales bacterium]